jgi:hypothetical protein
VDATGQIEKVFTALFEAEKIPAEDYRVRVLRQGLVRYEVRVNWEGFAGISAAAREEWVWKRLRPILPRELRFRVGTLTLRTASEHD